MTDFTAFPIANVTIPSLPDLGGITDATMLVGERAGTGRFAATGLRDYVMTTVGAGYVPLTGGTLFGNITVPSAIGFNVSGGSLVSDTTYTALIMDGAGYRLRYVHATGYLAYLRSDGGELWSVDSVGNSKVGNQLTVASSAFVGGGGIVYTGEASTGHAVAFGWDGSHLIGYIDGTNFDTLANSADLISYLPRAGGAIAGNLTVSGSTTSGSLIVSGTIAAGGSIATSGAMAAGTNINSSGIIVAGGDVFARGGHYYFGNADQAVLNTASTGTALRFSADGWALSWNASTGTLGYINNSSLAVFTVDSSGNGTFLGTVHGTNVTLLEDKVTELQARITDLERDRAELQETLSARIADLEGNIASRVMALEAQMAARTSD